MYWRTKEYPSDSAKKTPNAAESCTHMEGPTCFGFWPPSRGLRGICLRGLAIYTYVVFVRRRCKQACAARLTSRHSSVLYRNSFELPAFSFQEMRQDAGRNCSHGQATNTFELPASSFELLENTAIVS